MNTKPTESINDYDIWTEVEIQAFLILLKECPLELGYQSVYDIVSHIPGGIVINARFDGMVNPLGYIRAVPAKDAPRVITALEDNLHSRIRRHATTYRRSCSRRNRLLQLASRKCYYAIRKIKDKLGDAVLRTLSKEQYEQVTAPHYDAYRFRENTLNNRVRKIYKAAYPGVADKPYTRYVESVITRAQQQMMACESRVG